MKLTLLLLVTAGLGFADDRAKPADDLTRLQGVWKLVSATRDGKEMPEDRAKFLRARISGDTFTILDNGKAVEAGMLKLDITKDPKQIDMTLANDRRPALGIYELRRDTYKLCYSPPGKERPKTFAAKPGSGYTMAVWRRDRK